MRVSRSRRRGRPAGLRGSILAPAALLSLWALLAPAPAFAVPAAVPAVSLTALAASAAAKVAPTATSSPAAASPKAAKTAAPTPEEERLAALADVAETWGRGVEASIERAYRECFRTFVIGNRILTLRLPFAQNDERSELAESELPVSGGGKASPRELWESIGAILGSEDFGSYLQALSDGREKLVHFDLASRSWSASEERRAIERTRSGSYQGLPHRPAVLSPGRGARPEDVYNYLYCVGGIGIDCSGFVWHVLSSVAREGSLDLARAYAGKGGAAGLPRGARPELYVGTLFFDPRSGRTRALSGAIAELLPGDILLFRGEDGSFIHSAVIQSIDRTEGRIRYLQSTDESPKADRGVHESIILFDPARPEATLWDPSLRWLQLRGATFEGEPPPAFRDDGERFRAYPDSGGGVVARLRALEKTIAKLQKAAASP